MSMIYTLTLNPVIDVHFAMDGITRGQENYTRHRIRAAAGKGVNVSAALLRHGVNAPAFVLTGENGADEYMAMLKATGIEAVNLVVPGNLREYVSLNDASDGSETRICYRDFRASDEDVLTLGNMLAPRLQKGDVVCISGALPEGVSPSSVVRISSLFKGRGALVAIDCASMSASALAAASPWLIKPNLAEGRRLFDALTGNYFDYSYDPPVMDYSDAGPSFIAAVLGQLASNVLLSLGPDGARFSSPLTSISCPALPVERCYSTVGAGDNLLAGFLFGLPERCFANGGPVNIFDAKAALAKGMEFAAEICVEER
jgi:1-phosphofructokinase